MKKKQDDLIHEDADLELCIDDEELNAELIDQPLLFRKWVKIKARVHKNAKVIKQKLKEVEAQTHLRLSKAGGRVKDIEALVELDEEVIKMRHQLIEAEELLEEYEGIARAFFQRHESLKELCANVRKEMAE